MEGVEYFIQATFMLTTNMIYILLLCDGVYCDITA